MLTTNEATMLSLHAECARAQKAEARLRAALKPFAEVGRPLVAASASGAIPSEASAKYLKLEPLIAEDFANAARVFEQTVDGKA